MKKQEFSLDGQALEERSLTGDSRLNTCKAGAETTVCFDKLLKPDWFVLSRLGCWRAAGLVHRFFGGLGLEAHQLDT